MKKRKLHIGTSGFHYKDWPGKFYPRNLKSNEWLSYYAKHFSTVELNASFYRTPTDSTIKRWLKNTPKDFLFTIKASRIITHFLRLKYSEDALRNFLKILKPFEKEKKLGCVLYQLSPNFKKNRDVFETFLKKIPKKYTNVFEFRHESWNDKEIFELLKKYHGTYCIVSSGTFLPHYEATTQTVYIRFHGPQEIYSSKYSTRELKKWAEKIQDFLEEGKEVYAYFNNDVQAFAVENAKKFKEMLQKKAHKKRKQISKNTAETKQKSAV